MADLQQIRTGDKLQLEVEVVDITFNQLTVRAYGGSKHVIGLATINHAEHIPAPKAFKRGDWVRRGSQRGGLVYGMHHNPRTLYQVSWPDSTVSGEYGPGLEHDEAPE